MIDITASQKFKELSPAAQEKCIQRFRAKTDRMYLANEVLGYDFAECQVELFAQYPEFKVKLDEEGALVLDGPWGQQFDPRDYLILWSRGHYKTTAVMVVIAIQAILLNPEIRILIMQGNIKNTQERLKEMASHFLGTAYRSKLTDLFPEFCGRKDDDGLWVFTKKGLGLTKDAFTTPARKRTQLPQATVTVASPKTIKTGQHFELGIFDDLVNDQNYRSKVQLKKVQEDFDMCFPLIDPGCPRFVSGTRYAFGDLYDIIVGRVKMAPPEEKKKWHVSITTCWKDDNAASGIPRFPQFIGKDGNAHGFTKEILLQIMRDNPGVYASQYLNQPMLESQQIITEAEMNAATILPTQVANLSRPVFFVDLAAEGDTEPDDSVVIIGKLDERGNMFATGGNGGKWSIPQLANQIIVFAIKERPTKILIEETASAKYFVEYVKMVCRDKGLVLPLDYIKVNNQKDAKAIRIKAYAGHVKNGRLKFFVGLPYWDKLVKQSTRFQPNTKHAHDDYPDTMALMCVSFAGHYLSIPPSPIGIGSHDLIDVDEQGRVKNMGGMIRMLGAEPLPIPTKIPEEILTQNETMGGEFSC
jgi:predicted phage terminase large subunit-like protein